MTERLRLALLLALSGCIDASDENLALVAAPRVIATVAFPSEAAPGSQVRLQAIVATPDGPTTSLVRWSFCSTPRSPSDTTTVSPACVTQSQRPVESVGSEIGATIPADACKLFGSETPSGRAPIRADSTGGYYQPLRVAMDGGDVVLARLRLRCALPNAPLAVVREFMMRYKANLPPTILGVRAIVDGAEVSLDALPPSESIEVQLDADAASRETYPLYDPRTGTLSDRLERLSVAWFVTNGRVDEPVQSLDGLTAKSVWHPDEAMTRAWLWVVLRDDRGASAVATYRVQGAHRDE